MMDKDSFVIETPVKLPSPPRKPTLERSDNGAIWFMVFLPLFGLYMERWAESKWTGMFLWTVVVLSEVGCAFYDLCLLKKRGKPWEELKRWFWLAPLYVYLREKLLGRETYKAILLGVFSFAALTMNGFASSRLITTDTIPDAIEATYVSSLDNFSDGSAPGNIGDYMEQEMGKDREWECTKSGDVFTAVCSGQGMSITFEVEHDGFIYQGIRISKIVKDGKTLEGEDFNNELLRIFGGEDDSEDHSSEDDSGTDTVSDS